MSKKRRSASAQGPREKVASRIWILSGWVGERLNVLTLRFMRDRDGLQGLSDAALAQSLNASNPQTDGLRREIKVLSLPLLVQGCVGQGIDPGGLMKSLMEHALKPF